MLHPVIDLVQFLFYGFFRVDRSIDCGAVVGMDARHPVGPGARGVDRGAAEHGEQTIAHDEVIVFVLVFPASGGSGVEGHLYVRFQAQAVTFLLGVMQGGFKLVERQLFK